MIEWRPCRRAELNRIVAGATHHIQLSQPAAVIAAVEEVVAEVRSKSVRSSARRQN